MVEPSIKPFNILLITGSNFPYGGAGANYLRLLTTGLVKSQKYIHVLLQGGQKYGKYYNVSNEKNEIGGVTYEYCGYNNRPSNKIKKVIDTLSGIIVPPIYLIIRKDFKDLACVLIYNLWNYQTIFIFVICKLLKIKIINIIPEWYEKESIVTSKIKLFKYWDFLFGMKVISKYYDGLIVFSSYLKKYYIKKKYDTNMIFWQPNLLDISFFRQNSISNIKKKEKIRIAYCGVPTKKDGIDDLLKAFKILQNSNKENELLIIGDSTNGPSLIPSLSQKCEKLNINQRVIFSGLVETRNIPELLNSSDILVLSRPTGIFAQAGFPTKLGEYMACKKPVVVTAVGDIPLLLKDEYDVFLALPDNPDSIAEKLYYLICNPDIAKVIGENGFKWASSSLEYKDATRKISLFLEKVCGIKRQDFSN